MLKPNAFLTIILAAILTACGGSGDPVVPGGGAGGVPPGDKGGSDDSSVGVDITNQAIGYLDGATFRRGQLKLTDTNLPPSGTTQISFQIVDPDRGNLKIVTKGYGVAFKSTCADKGMAEFEPAKVTVYSGEYSGVTYYAKGCSGKDTITATLHDIGLGGEFDIGSKSLAAATADVTVAPPNAADIRAISTTPAISLKGVSHPSLPPQASVQFKVTDNSGNAIAGKTVNFSLTNNIGGVALVQSTTKTNNEGIARALVQAGTSQTVVSVIGSTLNDDGDIISTTSLPISISTGYPHQNKFSIAADLFNPHAFDHDGAEVKFTVSVGDAFGNPVPDGTVVNFIAESGIIDGNCSTLRGRCTALWTSGGERPGQADAAMGEQNEKIGMTTILAYTEGEAGFYDRNGNNLFDPGESYLTYPEAFLDTNWNQTYHPSKKFVDYNYDNSYTIAPTEFQGFTCSATAKAAGHCASAMHVRDSIRIMQSNKDVKMSLYTRSGNDFVPFSGTLSTTGGTIYVLVQDGNDNMPAVGTVFSLQAVEYTIKASKTGAVFNGIGLRSENFTNLTAPVYGELFHFTYTFSPSTPGALPGLTAKIELQVERGNSKATILLE